MDLIKVEDLSIEAEKALAISDALYQAIYNGDWNSDMYQWAFVVLLDLQNGLKESLGELLREMMERREDDGKCI